MHDLSNICTHVIEAIKILLAYMQIVFKDDTIYSETFTVKKLFAFIFGQNFEYCETQNKTVTSETVRGPSFQCDNLDMDDLVNGEISFVCSICERKFKIKSELRLHVNTIHEGKGFKCSNCPALFDFNSNLKEHFKSVHEKKKPEYR